MDATLQRRERYSGTDLLLRHCRSIGTAEHRVPARLRLEEALGPDLARRLVTSLTARSRRPEAICRLGRPAGADEEEDQEGENERDEQRRPLGDGDRDHPEVEEEEEDDCPEERLDATIDARRCAGAWRREYPGGPTACERYR